MVIYILELHEQTIIPAIVLVHGEEHLLNNVSAVQCCCVAKKLIAPPAQTMHIVPRPKLTCYQHNGHSQKRPSQPASSQANIFTAAEAYMQPSLGLKL